MIFCGLCTQASPNLNLQPTFVGGRHPRKVLNFIKGLPLKYLIIQNHKKNHQDKTAVNAKHKCVQPERPFFLCFGRF